MLTMISRNMNPDRIRRLLRRFGPVGLMRSVMHRYVGTIVARQFPNATTKQVRGFINAATDTPHLIVYSTLDWNFPFDQRVHHLVYALAEMGWKIIFVSPNQGYDHFWFSSQPHPNIIVTYNFTSAINAIENPNVYFISADNRLSEEMASEVFSRSGLICYDYLDAIDELVSNMRLTPERIALHQSFLLDVENVFVISTADEIYDDVERFRHRHHAKITNGVDAKHFMERRRSDSVSPAFKRLMQSGKPVLGYYGALATWFDYELLIDLAEARPNYQIVLIGPDYDGSKTALNGCPENIRVFEPVSYKELPHYAKWFDVALIPFRINDITTATSPLKLFEYMALGLPIVSTPIKEAFNYQSVRIAEAGLLFAEAVDQAVRLGKDPSYVALLARDAMQNDWSAKAKDFERMTAAFMSLPRR